jgi:acyl-CoA dehydrogenase
MFLVDRRAPGVTLVRNVPVMAPDLLDHKEAEFRFERVRVKREAVLGKIGDGFRLAQQRLVPARLTHCMRWLGLADRTLHLSKKYVNERISFGKPLASHQLVQHMFAENATRIHAGNLMTLHCASMLEAGMHKEARVYSSMTKNLLARLLCDVLDDAIQMHGARGYSHDMPFARWYASARAARIADGPDEVHEMVIAREFLADRLELLV